jgi:hypothetical protein
VREGGEIIRLHGYSAFPCIGRKIVSFYPADIEGAVKKVVKNPFIQIFFTTLSVNYPPTPSLFERGGALVPQ